MCHAGQIQLNILTSTSISSTSATRTSQLELENWIQWKKYWSGPDDVVTSNKLSDFLKKFLSSRQPVVIRDLYYKPTRRIIIKKRRKNIPFTIVPVFFIALCNNNDPLITFLLSVTSFSRVFKRHLPYLTKKDPYLGSLDFVWVRYSTLISFMIHHFSNSMSKERKISKILPFLRISNWFLKCNGTYVT